MILWIKYVLLIYYWGKIESIKYIVFSTLQVTNSTNYYYAKQFYFGIQTITFKYSKYFMLSRSSPEIAQFEFLVSSVTGKLAAKIITPFLVRLRKLITPRINVKSSRFILFCVLLQERGYRIKRGWNFFRSSLKGESSPGQPGPIR